MLLHFDIGCGRMKYFFFMIAHTVFLCIVSMCLAQCCFCLIEKDFCVIKCSDVLCCRLHFNSFIRLELDTKVMSD